MLDKNNIDYANLLRQAHIGVMRTVLSDIAATGSLPGEHHFQIVFRTDIKGVEMPDKLRVRFPKEMTIIIQHQFWDLQIGTDWFAIVLNFGGVPSELRIPFESVTRFVDPFAGFGLSFELAETEQAPEQQDTASAPAESGTEASGDVVSLDAFRKHE